MKAIERNDEHHVDKHGRILKMKEQMQIETVFLGDSLTRRWEEHTDLWDDYFAKFYPANFGVGADTLENIYWRITEGGELDGLKPSVLIFLGGTNNLSSNSPDEIEEFIFEILKVVRQKLANTKIVLLGLTPRNPDDTCGDYITSIVSVNKKLSLFPQKPEFLGKLSFLDIGTYIPRENGRVPANIAPDGLHLDTEGYKIVGPLIANSIKKMRLAD